MQPALMQNAKAHILQYSKNEEIHLAPYSPPSVFFVLFYRVFYFYKHLNVTQFLIG